MISGTPKQNVVKIPQPVQEQSVAEIPLPPPLPSVETFSPTTGSGFNTARPTFEPVRLHFAINQEDLKASRDQVNKGVDVNFIIHGNTPLMLAMLRRQYDIVMLLLDAGADATIPEIYAWKRQPIHLAAMCNRVDIVSALLDHGASIQAADGMCMTPLHWAASYGALDTVNLLLDRDVHLEVRDDRGKTPLCRAATNNHTEVVTLLRSEGAQVNIQDVNGWTPLHQAVFCSLPIIRCLLELCSNPNIRDHRGNTVLHLMMRRNDYDNLRLLASTDLQFYTRDRKITSSCTQNITEFLDDKDILLDLLDYGLDLNMKNAAGYSGMDLAIKSSHFTFVQWLIHCGAVMSLSVNSYPVGWPQNLLDNQPMCDFLRLQGADRITCLKALCKTMIRKHLYPAISISISKLPLPTPLKSYLLIEIELIKI